MGTAAGHRLLELTESPREREIREAMERVNLADLPGGGKPLHLDDDPQWWARKFMEREKLRDEVIEMAQRLRRELPAVVATPDDDVFERRLGELASAVDSLRARAGDQAEGLPELDVDEIRRRRNSRR